MYAKQLREQLLSLATQMTAIVNLAKNENNRGLTTLEAEQFDRLEADYSLIEASIKRAEKADALQADLRTVDPAQALALFPANPASVTAAANTRHEQVFNNYMRRGMEGLNTEDRAFMATLIPQNVTPLNVSTPMSTTTGSQGGFLVPQGFSDQLTEAMLWYGGTEGSVGEFTTTTGNPTPWPTVNDTNNVGEIVGQNVAVSIQNIVFNQVVFNAYIFSSKMVQIPLALLEDSYFDLNAFVAKMLGIRLGRILNTKFTVGAGSGSSEPLGIVTAAVAAGNTYTAPTGETTSLVYNDLVSLEHAVNPSYRYLPTSKYMFHDSTLKVLKQLKDSALRPLWQPGLTASFQTGAEPQILGHGYIINNDMPVMAANANSILFGDMSAYKIRKVAGDIQLLRLVERYAEYLQVGLIAFVRRDGNLIDAGTHPIAVFVNSAT